MARGLFSSLAEGVAVSREPLYSNDSMNPRTGERRRATTRPRFSTGATNGSGAWDAIKE